MVKNSKKILKLKKKIKEIRYNFLKLISKGVKYHIGGKSISNGYNCVLDL